MSNIVEPGDRITFASMPKELLNDRITGPALDDRSGVGFNFVCVGAFK